MQLNLTTDYAIRSLLYLAGKPEGDSTQGISQAIGIERFHTQKILRRLQKHGLVRSSMGSSGGFFLNKEPGDISLLDIIVAMEKTIFLNRCMEEDQFCNITMTGTCPVRATYMDLQEKMEEYFSSWTLTRLLERTTSC